MEDKNISVSQLTLPDHEGFMTKCGLSVKSWKKRWFILKGNLLYYFKTKKDKKATGVIVIAKESFVKEDNLRKPGKTLIALGTLERVYFMFADTIQEQNDWMNKLKATIDRLIGTSLKPSVVNGQTGGTNNVGGQIGGTTTNSNGTSGTTSTTTVSPVNSGHSTSGGNILVRVKEFIPFMVDDSNRVIEFWNIWFESVPKPNDSSNSNLYQLLISCDGNELSWRASGTQNLFIQTMVDFFWNVGAPESEIDKLNDFGTLVNPSSIGSWINLSKFGGMDGGWFFPVPLSLKIALEACDPDHPSSGNIPAGSEEILAVKTFTQWTEANKIEDCIYIGRDMGAAPPRQTEIRVRLSQSTVAEQLNVALSAFSAFRFPSVPNNLLNILRQFTNPGIVLSVITSTEGFVKIGILFPNPNWSVAMQLIEEGRTLSQNQPTPLDVFNKLNSSFRSPESIELQYLNPGFGYNVYKEDFNVILHYQSN